MAKEWKAEIDEETEWKIQQLQLTGMLAWILASRLAFRFQLNGHRPFHEQIEADAASKQHAVIFEVTMQLSFGSQPSADECALQNALVHGLGEPGPEVTVNANCFFENHTRDGIQLRSGSVARLRTYWPSDTGTPAFISAASVRPVLSVHFTPRALRAAMAEMSPFRHAVLSS